MLGGTPGWRPPGAQGQPGDTTEVDQSIVQEVPAPHLTTPSHPTHLLRPTVTRSHLYVRDVEPRLYRASSCLYFLSPSPASCPLCWGSERADPALNGSARSLSASPVFKVHNMPPDSLGFSKVRCFPQPTLQTLW